MRVRRGPHIEALHEDRVVVGGVRGEGGVHAGQAKELAGLLVAHAAHRARVHEHAVRRHAVRRADRTSPALHTVSHTC